MPIMALKRIPVYRVSGAMSSLETSKTSTRCLEDIKAFVSSSANTFNWL